jgi:hypothetical protein
MHTVKHRTQPTKAQQMRALIVKMQERGDKPRPVDLQRTLAAQGVTISSGHASIVLRAFLGRRRGRRNGTKPENGHHVAEKRAASPRETEMPPIAQTAEQVRQLTTALNELHHAIASLQTLLR